MAKFLNVLVLFYKMTISLVYSVFRFFKPPAPKKISGEIVLVTGAGHGMGRLQAIEFAKLGATVIVVDVIEKNNNKTANEIREIGGNVFAFGCDLTDKGAIKRLANNVREEVGDVTILVNNAGVAHVDNILDLNEEKIERTFQVNILAHFWTIREFLPAMKRNNHGHIVNLASQGGLEGIPFLTDYCASKFACVGMSTSLMRELRWMKLDGITITCVCPSFVDTGFLKNPSLEAGAVLKPEAVVEKIIEGVQYNRNFVHVPDTRRISQFLTAIYPHETTELMFDFANPRCESGLASDSARYD